MTAVTTGRADGSSALAPITAALDAMLAHHGPRATHGLAPGLHVTDPRGWIPAADIVDGGAGLTALLDSAARRWGAAPHAAAALAWKAYAYWVALPAVLGWAGARRVPTPHPDDILIRLSDHDPHLTIGLQRATVAVLPTDPAALLPHTGTFPVQVTPTEAALLSHLRTTLLDHHLHPLLDRIRDRVHIGRRTLLGSVAAGIAHGILRASDAVPGSAANSVTTLLDALGLDGLVDLAPAADGGPITVRRRTCCLAFTLPSPKVCTGCCIRSTEVSRQVARR